jgi:hypothetical protein
MATGGREGGRRKKEGERRKKKTEREGRKKGREGRKNKRKEKETNVARLTRNGTLCALLGLINIKRCIHCRKCRQN